MNEAGARSKDAVSGSTEGIGGGVSVVICCYNSAARLPATLAHLESQRDADAVSWELIVVDNASSDETTAVARRHWPSDGRVPLTVITETRRGVAYARAAGFEAARYGAVSFIDDDNWVCDRWVARAAQVMAGNPEVGACGGYSASLCEGPTPRWFQRYRQYYAIGPEPALAGAPPDTLWFAGMTVRAQAWRDLRRGGFRFLTEFGAEDNEISLALRLAGWKLRVDEELRLTHVLPAARLTWKYFRELQRARFAAMVVVDPYRFAIDDSVDSGVHSSPSWSRELAKTIKALLRNLLMRPHKVICSHARAYEGDDDVFRIELQRGRLAGLIRYRREYNAYVRAVACAAWRNQRAGVRA
jgi:glycosyltransferase involved in cell wall biosynthesis